MVDTAFVAGGGPAGLAAAIALRAKGLRVIVSDGNSPAIDKACGEGLMPDSLAAASRLGISIPEDAGFAFRGIRFCGPEHTVDANFPRGHGLGLRRTVLHARLIAQAERAGVELRWKTPLTSLNAMGARWIIGADGAASSVRRWAGLDRPHRNSRRFAFRRHYGMAPWTDCLEIHWSRDCQFYVTPVSDAEVGLVLISHDAHLRIDAALEQVPRLCQRLAGAPASSNERGAVTAICRYRRVTRNNIALIGDASGTVDAITGEGLCMAFRQAELLATSIAEGSLARYQQGHGALLRRPTFMADSMLLLDRRTGLRNRVLRSLEAKPALFADLLAMHVGERSLLQMAATGVQLGWGLLGVNL